MSDEVWMWGERFSRGLAGKAPPQLAWGVTEFQLPRDKLYSRIRLALHERARV